MWRSTGKKKTLTCLVSAVQSFNKKSPLQYSPQLGVTWNGSSSPFSASRYQGCFQDGRVGPYLTTIQERQSSPLSGFSMSQDTEKSSMVVWSFFFIALAATCSAEKLLFHLFFNSNFSSMFLSGHRFSSWTALRSCVAISTCTLSWFRQWVKVS